MVASTSSPPGADITTFLAPAAMCAEALALLVNKPVHSSTKSTPILPWGEMGVDFVLECTGLFTSKAKASAHIAAGGNKGVVSAPGGDDVDATIGYGAEPRGVEIG